MRILFTKRGFSPVGGSESLCYQFATRLAARGHDVRVLCVWPTESEELRYPADRFVPRTYGDHRVFRDEGVEVVQVKPRGGFLGVAADAVQIIDMTRGDILERCAEGRDLIHNICREYTGSSFDVAQELEIPIVLTPLPHPGQFHGGDTPQDVARYRRAAAITTMTEWERGWFVRRDVDPGRVFATGMGPNATQTGDAWAFRRARGIPDGAPVVLYIGRKERYKGYIQLLDAAEEVWRSHPETRFVFVGIQGFYSTFFDDFARYTDERIIDIQEADAETKHGALAACDVFAMPSRHETFGLGYLEAWLHRKPVIACDIPPVREVVGDDGLLVEQRADDIAAAIIRLVEDPALRERMGRSGEAKVRERWDWEHVMDRVEQAYAAAVAAGAASAPAEVAAP